MLTMLRDHNKMFKNINCKRKFCGDLTAKSNNIETISIDFDFKLFIHTSASKFELQ